MRIVIDLYGEAAEKYKQDKLSETMRRLITGNEWACEKKTGNMIREAFKHSHCVREDDVTYEENRIKRFC